MRRLKVLLPLCLSTFLLMSCNEASTGAPSTTSVPVAYQGTWKISLGGDLTGGGDMLVENGGAFTADWTMYAGGANYLTHITGSVTSAGVVQGTITSDNSKIGDLAGKIDSAGITSTGTYSLSTPQNLSGPWNGLKSQ